MQPTADAELAGVSRALAELAAGPEPVPGMTATLGQLARTLDRLRKTGPEVLPYLVRDISAVHALLTELAPDLPADLRREVAEVTAPPPGGSDPTALPVGLADPALLHDTQERARALLSRVIAVVPPPPSPRGPDAGGPRARIIECLRASLDHRPW